MLIDEIEALWRDMSPRSRNEILRTVVASAMRELLRPIVEERGATLVADAVRTQIEGTWGRDMVERMLAVRCEREVRDTLLARIQQMAREMKLGITITIGGHDD